MKKDYRNRLFKYDNDSMTNMHKQNKFECPFCNYPAGEWRHCPGCSAPKYGRGKWLAKRWNLKVAKKSNSDKILSKTCNFNQEGRFWNSIENFPAAIFDSKGYVHFDTKADYLNHPCLYVKKNRTNTLKHLTLSDFPDYQVGLPPVSE
tara:strand:- start:78 stop:521 length:444 start_codon:yes stop_codon:yes gene_type:complete